MYFSRRFLKFIFAFLLITSGGAPVFSQNIVAVEGTGLKSVYLVPDDEASDITAHLIIHRGERENPYAEGLAHYVEHLAALSAFQFAAGDFGRHSQATTNLFTTEYYQTAEPGRLNEILEKLYKTMQPFSLSKAFMEQERKIVLREWDYRRGKNVLYQPLREMELSLTTDMAISRDVLGSKKDISQFSLEQAEQLHRETHIPRNASLIVYGDVDVTLTEQLIRDIFLRDDRLGVTFHPLKKAIPDKRHLDEIEVSGLKRPMLVYEKIIAAPGVKKNMYNYIIQDMLDDVLRSQQAGTLATPLRYDEFLVRAFHISVFQRADDQISLRFDAVPDRGVSLRELLGAFETEIGERFANGLPIDSVEEIKQRAIYQIETNSNKAKLAYWLVKRGLRYGEEPLDYEQYLSTHMAIEPFEINQLLERFSGPGHTEIRLLYP